MYFVKYGNEYLHDPRIDGYMLLDLSLDCEENSCGYCDFTIYPNHPMYNKLRERDADNPIEVYDDDILLFAGFIYELGKEFYLDGHVKCKGELDYLSESIIRPYSTIKRKYGNVAPYTVNEYFAWLIEQHNKQVPSNKQFIVGINQGSKLDTNNYIYRQNDRYPKTIDEIREKILDSLGGYIRVRHEDGVKYIDLLYEWDDVNSQVLNFGENLTDYTQTDDSSELATFVIPVGAQMQQTEYPYNQGYSATTDTKMDSSKTYYTQRSEYTEQESLESFDDGVIYYEYKSSNGMFFVTSDTNPHSDKTYYTRKDTYTECTNLEAFETGVTYYEYDYLKDESELLLSLTDYPDGQCATDFVISGDMIYCISAVEKYGYIGYTYEDSELTTKRSLIAYGLVDLKERVSPKRTIEIKAVDMHFINPSMKPIQIGEYVRVRSVPHNIDEYFLCRNIELDLNNPENSVYTLGCTYDTLTGQQNKKINSLNATINKQYEAAAALSEEAKASAKKAADTAEDARKDATEAKEAAASAIVSAYDEYAVSYTPETAPTEDWSVDPPEYTSDKFIWKRTNAKYGDGSSVTGKAVLITGNTGANGKNGADAITMSIISSNGTVFKNNSSSTVLTVHVYVAGVEQSITDAGVCGSLGSVKWYKSGSTTAVATAKTLTVSASDVTNSAAYTCQLEV